MAYPVEIIPNWHYSRKIDLKAVLKREKTFYICRAVFASQEERDAIKEGEPLDVDLLGDHIVRMSVNLMGGLYEPSHLRYLPSSAKDATKEWKGQKIILSDYLSGNEDKNYAFGLYYSSEDLHRKLMSVTLVDLKKPQKDAAKKVFQHLCEDVYGIHVDVEIFVESKPTNVNYWHAQVEMKPALEDDEKCFRNGDGWKKDIYAQLVSDILTKKHKLSLPDTAKIICCDYCCLSDKCGY